MDKNNVLVLEMITQCDNLLHNAKVLVSAFVPVLATLHMQGLLTKLSKKVLKSSQTSDQ
jgi:hypothetical protein